MDETPINKIPYFIEKGVRPGVSLNEFLENKKKNFSLTTEGLNFINSSTLSALEERRIKKHIRIRRNLFLLNDENLDGNVTIDEIMSMNRSIEYMHSVDDYERRTSEILEAFKEKDLDQNGVLTHAEMVMIPEPVKGQKSLLGRHKKNQLDSYLSVDPNGDGVLSLDEFLDVSQNFFKRIDIDGNYILSDDEVSQYKIAVQKARGVEAGASAEALRAVEFGTIK